jgi:hypothetical protein
MIDDLCANNDCRLSDECRMDYFENWDDWHDAHRDCYLDEDEEPRNDNFFYEWTFDEDKEVWVRN